MSTQEGTILGALLCCYYDCGFMFLSQSHTISYLPSLALHRSRVTHTTWLLVITSDLKYGHVRPATYQLLAIWRLARFFLIAKKQGNNKKQKCAFYALRKAEREDGGLCQNCFLLSRTNVIAAKAIIITTTTYCTPATPTKQQQQQQQ